MRSDASWGRLMPPSPPPLCRLARTRQATSSLPPTVTSHIEANQRQKQRRLHPGRQARRDPQGLARRGAVKHAGRAFKPAQANPHRTLAGTATLSLTLTALHPFTIDYRSFCTSSPSPQKRSSGGGTSDDRTGGAPHTVLIRARTCLLSSFTSRVSPIKRYALSKSQ